MLPERGVGIIKGVQDIFGLSSHWPKLSVLLFVICSKSFTRPQNHNIEREIGLPAT